MQEWNVKISAQIFVGKIIPYMNIIMKKLKIKRLPCLVWFTVIHFIEISYFFFNLKNYALH